MAKPSASQRTFLRAAADHYRLSMNGSPAAELLEARGLAEGTEAFGLGYVADPLPGHEQYRGMLSVPYLRRSVSGWSVVSMRFRCVVPECPHNGHGKYMSLPGDTPRLFNTPVLLADHDWVAITEGEIDAVSASVSGVPAVGVSGVESWKPHWRLPFLGYEAVYVLADGDDPGMRFARGVAKELPNAKILPSAPGEDVNSEMVARGRGYIRDKVMRSRTPRGDT